MTIVFRSSRTLIDLLDRTRSMARQLGQSHYVMSSNDNNKVTGDETETAERKQQNQIDHDSDSDYEYEAMKNFRELLWYWQEYYCRRGRDRLSVEFTCRIPFAAWTQLVGMYCLYYLSLHYL